MPFNNGSFGQELFPFRDSPFTSTIQFPAAPAGEILMITESDDLMITETTNEDMATE